MSVDGERLLLTGPSGRSGEILPLPELRFVSQDTGNQFTFTRRGRVVTALVIDQQGQRFAARRMP